MKIKFDPEFLYLLTEQIDIIALDKPKAAKAFKQEFFDKCRSLAEMPHRCRKSIYYDDERVRDMIYKGYTVVYVIREDEIIILSLINHQNFIPESIDL
jgi:plasmid stabilization system protein ParE